MNTFQPIFNLKFIKALADPLRQNILLMLGEKGEMSSGQIAEAFLPMTHATISHHLQILKEGGVLVSRKEGKTALYAIDKTTLTSAMDKLAGMISNCCLGADCCGGGKTKKGV
ncbi:MAG: metalloregulator ArsR/SmtB family transcription factor [Nitrospinota bacterium]|nr:metalloregulator ArsR/SmtB family transcription factor [Nitrospinota bacterium]